MIRLRYEEEKNNSYTYKYTTKTSYWIHALNILKTVLLTLYDMQTYILYIHTTTLHIKYILTVICINNIYTFLFTACTWC
jgi:hypothetical protein